MWSECEAQPNNKLSWNSQGHYFLRESSDSLLRFVVCDEDSRLISGAHGGCCRQTFLVTCNTAESENKTLFELTRSWIL